MMKTFGRQSIGWIRVEYRIWKRSARRLGGTA